MWFSDVSPLTNPSSPESHGAFQSLAVCASFNYHGETATLPSERRKWPGEDDAWRRELAEWKRAFPRAVARGARGSRGLQLSAGTTL